MPYLKKIIKGEVFCELTIIKQVSNTLNHKQRTVLCLCQCKMERVLIFSQITRGIIKNCGSMIHRQKYKNSVENKRMCNIWENMKTRCYTKCSPSYKRYGGRGITVSDIWLASFDNFYEDMKDGYANNLSLDRIDVNGNYCKVNCKWSDRKTQSMNRRNTIYVLFNNKLVKFFDIKEDLEKLGHNWKTIKTRMYRGLSFEDALCKNKISKRLLETDVISICKLINGKNCYREIKEYFPLLTEGCFYSLKSGANWGKTTEKYLIKKPNKSIRL